MKISNPVRVNIRGRIKDVCSLCQKEIVDEADLCLRCGAQILWPHKLYSTPYGEFRELPDEQISESLGDEEEELSVPIMDETGNSEPGVEEEVGPETNKDKGQHSVAVSNSRGLRAEVQFARRNGWNPSKWMQ